MRSLIDETSANVGEERVASQFFSPHPTAQVPLRFPNKIVLVCTFLHHPYPCIQNPIDILFNLLLTFYFGIWNPLDFA